MASQITSAAVDAARQKEAVDAKGGGKLKNKGPSSVFADGDSISATASEMTTTAICDACAKQTAELESKKPGK